MTTAIYLPVVAPSLVSGTAAASFGAPQLGALFFGAGVLSWLAIESMVLQRAATDPAPLVARRPLLGIQIAPPVVAGMTYLSLTHGRPDLVAWALLGYGIYQGLLMLRLLPWIGRQSFAPSYWGFSFGVAALPAMAMRMAERGAGDLAGWLAVVLFVVANVVIGLLGWKTLELLMTGALLTPMRNAPAGSDQVHRPARCPRNQDG